MITIHKVAVKCPFFLNQSFMTWSLVIKNFYCWLDTTSSCMDLFSRTQIKTDGAEREGLSCPDMAGTPRLRLRHGLQTPSYNALEITDRYRKIIFQIETKRFISSCVHSKIYLEFDRNIQSVHDLLYFTFL